MKRIAPTVIVLALSGAFAFWWFSPRQVVKRRTGTLLRTLTLEEGGAGRRMAVYSLNALLAPEVELATPEVPEADGSFTRADVESAFTWLCGQARQTRFEAREFRAITVDGDHATVALMLDALVELPGRSLLDGPGDAVFHWRKGNDGWRLSRAEWHQVPGR